MRKVDYKGKNVARSPSRAIWANCPWNEILYDPTIGHCFYDDFMHFETMAAGASAVSYGKYYIDGDTGVLLAADSNTDYGAVANSSDDAEDDGFVLVYGSNAGWMRFTTAERNWFECRIKVASITNGDVGWFAGAVETSTAPTAADTLVDDTAVLNTTEDFIGFRVLGSDADALECIYQEGSATLVNVGDADSTIETATYYKMGFYWDGWDTGANAGKLYYFLDNVLVQTLTVTSSLSFPDANHMAICLAFKSLSTAAIESSMDWWRMATQWDRG